MKRLAIVSCVALLTLAGSGCGGNDNPTAPSNTTVFQINLLPSNEVPPITNAESSGRGTGVITVHSDTNKIDFSFNMTGFPNGTVITNAHIHPGAAGTNGGVKVAAGVASPITLSNGSGTFINTVDTSAQNIADILGAPQNFYFNIHSSTNPGGVARGQLK